MRFEFGLLGCILTIDSTENCSAECSVRFIYIQHRAALGWIFGDGRAVGSDGLTVVCNRLYFQGGNREFDKTLCWGSDFGLLGCILNSDSPKNRLVECSVRFIYIQHRAPLGWLFGDGRDVGSDGLRVVCNRLYFQGGNREFVGAIAEEIGNDYNPSQQLWLDAGENRGSHSLCTISVNVDCLDEFVRDREKPLHGSSDLSRSQEAERILLCETVNSC